MNVEICKKIIVFFDHVWFVFELIFATNFKKTFATNFNKNVEKNKKIIESIKLLRQISNIYMISHILKKYSNFKNIF